MSILAQCVNCKKYATVEDTGLGIPSKVVELALILSGQQVVDSLCPECAVIPGMVEKTDKFFEEKGYRFSTGVAEDFKEGS